MPAGAIAGSATIARRRRRRSSRATPHRQSVTVLRRLHTVPAARMIRMYHLPLLKFIVSFPPPFFGSVLPPRLRPLHSPESRQASAHGRASVSASIAVTVGAGELPVTVVQPLDGGNSDSEGFGALYSHLDSSNWSMPGPKSVSTQCRLCHLISTSEGFATWAKGWHPL